MISRLSMSGQHPGLLRSAWQPKRGYARKMRPPACQSRPEEPVLRVAWAGLLSRGGKAELSNRGTGLAGLVDARAGNASSAECQRTRYDSIGALRLAFQAAWTSVEGSRSRTHSGDRCSMQEKGQSWS